MKHSAWVFLIFLAACGGNPHVSTKDIATETILPGVESSALEATSPELILRDSDSKKEGLVDFGDLKVGESSSRDLELTNVGSETAKSLTIPVSRGNFNVINVDCGQQLDVGESCHLKVKISAKTERLEREDLIVEYKGKEKDFSVNSYLVGQVKAEPKKTEPKPSLIIIPKNTSSGIVLLKDVPLNEERVISLELRNIGQSKALGLSLPKLSAPYRLIDQTCSTELEATAFCEINLAYLPAVVKDDELKYTVNYQGGEVTQLVLANAVKLDLPGRIEVSGSTITQDIYEIINLKPEMLSPFQEVRGLDLGNLLLNKESTLRIQLSNSGQQNAQIIKVSNFQTPEFKLNGPFPGAGGTCAQTMKPGTCEIVFTVTPKDMKNIHDLMEITYEDGQGHTRRLSLVLFASVKKDPLVACKTLAARSSAEQSTVLKGLANYKLPYKTKSPEATLAVLVNTDSNVNLRFLGKRGSLVVPTVKNAMVQFGFELSAQELAKYRSVKIELDILKIGVEGVKFDTTEVLCLNESKRCSGSFFIDSHYSTLNSKTYDLVSGTFSTELLKSSQENLLTLKDLVSSKGLSATGQAKASNNIFRLKKKFPLEALFGDTSGLSIENGLNFVLADDSHLLSVPRLILESLESECKN